MLIRLEPTPIGNPVVLIAVADFAVFEVVVFQPLLADSLLLAVPWLERASSILILGVGRNRSAYLASNVGSLP